MEIFFFIYIYISSKKLGQISAKNSYILYREACDILLWTGIQVVLSNSLDVMLNLPLNYGKCAFQTKLYAFTLCSLQIVSYASGCQGLHA